MTANFDFEKAESLDEELARLKHEIKEEVRQSVRAALADVKNARHQIRIEMRRRAREDCCEEPVEASRDPVAGSSERQAILDAIARGEMSVDDAIKKLTGD